MCKFLLYYPFLLFAFSVCSRLDFYDINDLNGVGAKFDGIGAISGGGATSKLLQNYKEPLRTQILDFLFKPGFGASLQILKVEIGGDSQSTDGSESSHMHSEDDLNFNRGYEWWLMKEAKQRNPRIELYGLPWVWPGWLGGPQKDSPYKNLTNTVRYVVNWVHGAKSFHGLSIDYLGIWNERPYDITYIKLLRSSLDENGFKTTKIVGGDSSGWKIATDALKDRHLMDSLSVIGSHYAGSVSSSDARHTSLPLWQSEDFSTFNDQAGGACWARILNEGYVNGYMTASIAWNLITSYYDGLPYTRNSLMTANQPWSGHYQVNSPIWATAHHTQLYEKGWRYLRHSSGVGSLKGGGTYIALTDQSRTRLTIIIETMDPAKALCLYKMPKYSVSSQTAEFSLGGSFKNITELNVWESKFFFNSSSTFFIKQNTLKVLNRKFTLTLNPNTLLTLTTTATGNKGSFLYPPPPQAFPLPYNETFDGFPISSEPFNFAQQAGAFEIVEMPGQGQTVKRSRDLVLKQCVDEPPIDTCLPKKMPDTVNIVGDNSGRNIYVSLDFYVPTSNTTYTENNTKTPEPTDKVVCDSRSVNGCGGDLKGCFKSDTKCGNSFGGDKDVKGADDLSGVYGALRTSSGGCDAMRANGVYFSLFTTNKTFIVSTNAERTKVLVSGFVNVDFYQWNNIALYAKDTAAWGTLNEKRVFTIDLSPKHNVPQNGFTAFGTIGFGVAYFNNFYMNSTE